KSNVTAGCKLFRRIYDEVAAGYPDIRKDYAYIDAFQQWLVRSPEAYDVAVTSNVFGDIATDLAAVLQGGMGMAAGGNIGDAHAMFEPIHGSAPKHAGRDEVNPIAMILAVQMMLDWLGRRKKDKALRDAAVAVEAAVDREIRGPFESQRPLDQEGRVRRGQQPRDLPPSGWKPRDRIVEGRENPEEREDQIPDGPDLALAPQATRDRDADGGVEDPDHENAGDQHDPSEQGDGRHHREDDPEDDDRGHRGDQVREGDAEEVTHLVD